MNEASIPSILSLARAGATSRAWDAFRAGGLEGVEDFNALTLKGRLLKDRARQATGAERAALFAQSGAAYARAATLRPDSYPLINAAAMALFAGDGASASNIARDVLMLLDSNPRQGETPYWREATRAEALLLTGQIAPAKFSLAAAIAMAPQAWEDHASTLRQFSNILSLMAEDAVWLDEHRPRPALHFSGILGVAPDDLAATHAINAAVGAINPGSGFGALAAGADIIAAEAIVALGAELHVVLPAEPSDFSESSVVPFGAEWLSRFHNLIETCASLTICGEMSRAGIALAEYRAMGMAAERANLLETRALAMRIEPGDRPALGDPWLNSGREMVHVEVSASSLRSIAALPDGQLQWLLMMKSDVGVAEPLGFGALAEMLGALPRGTISAAIDLRVDGERGGLPALLQNAAPDTIIASTTAAMALIAEGRASRAEPLGEMETTDGATGVYSVILDSP
jgi:hypothetical protein